MSFFDPDFYDGWLEKVKLKLTSAKVEVEVEVELGKKSSSFSQSYPMPLRWLILLMMNTKCQSPGKLSMNVVVKSISYPFNQCFFLFEFENVVEIA